MPPLCIFFVGFVFVTNKNKKKKKKKEKKKPQGPVAHVLSHLLSLTA